MRTVSSLFLVPLMILALIGGDKDDAKANDKTVIELATVCLGDLCGYVNSQGQWRIPPKFRAADPFSKDGLARVIVQDGFFKSDSYLPSHGGPWSDMAYAGSMGLIDVNGNFVLQPKFGEIRSFANNGLAAVKMNGPESEERDSFLKRSYKWGFADANGQLVIEARFEAVGDFSDNGLAAAQVYGRWGFIDSSGQWIIRPLFDSVKPFLNSGLALAREYKYEEPESQWHRPRSVGKMGFIDVSGQWVVAPVLDRVNNFFDTGLAVAVVNKKAGLINSSGQWLIEPEFREIWFPQGSKLGTAITISGKRALLNTSGQWITEPILDGLGRLVYGGEKVTSASLGGKVGIINVEKGQWLAEAKFDEISEFNDQGLATVKLNGKFGLINNEGKLIIEPQFHQLQAEPNNGLFAAGNNGQWGLINLEGQWVVEPKFDNLQFVSDNGPIAAREKGKWGLIDRQGNWTVEPKLDGIKRFYDNGLAWAQMSRGQETIQSHTGIYEIDAYHYGLINAQGQWVVEPKFENLYFFSDKDLSYAEINDKWGVVDATGQWIIKPQFSGMVLAPRSGNVAEVNTGSGIHIRCYLDYHSAAYRTGSDKNVEEPGFRWEFANGVRTLFNRQGKKILTVENAGQVAKNSAGVTIWPLASVSKTDEDKQ